MRRIAIVPVVAVLSAVPAFAQQGDMMQGGQGEMMGQREMPNLKELAPKRAVQAVKYCKGQYLVSTAAGDVLEFSEFTLRIKTDVTEDGPVVGKPALLPAGMSGMMGDRAFLVFSDPAELSGYIEKKCN